MLHACRRGPASICRVANAATTSFSPIARPSELCHTISGISKPALISRALHVSSLLQFERRGGGGGRDRDRRGGSRFGGGRDTRYKKQEESEDLGEEPASYVPEITKFQELADKGLVNPAIIKNITEGMGHHTMTEVQAMTINETVDGRDALAQARTGTGKTLGFLVPVLTNILRASPELADPPSRYDRAKPSDIRAIIISPTRELAEQIAVEARKLTRNTSMVVQTAVGGTGKRDMLRDMQRYGCHILVATPGRLHDLLQDEYSRVRAPGLKAIVLDEADRLLDDGFSAAIEDIMDLLPAREEVDRQTLLFSATVPKEVMRLVRRTLKPGFHFVQAVKQGEAATHEKVPQHLVACKGMENMMPALMELCKTEIDKAQAAIAAGVPGARPFKAIVYYSNLAMVELSGDIFASLKQQGGSLFGKHPLAPARISEMHSKLSQAGRTKVSERFRRADSAIMFSSDVTARGMDFPGVTHVIQMGLPPSKEQYIHRVGRTGRGDSGGEGYIMVADFELPEVRHVLRGIPLMPNTSLEAPQVDMTRSAQLSAELATIFTQVGDATKMVDRGLKNEAFRAMLSVTQRVRDKEGALEQLVRWTKYGWGWEKPPQVSASLASKMRIPSRSGLVSSGSAEDRDGGRGRDDSGRGQRGGFERKGGYGSDFGRDRSDRGPPRERRERY